MFQNERSKINFELMSELENKVAVVTGGNSGIGYASAKKFKEQGATVVIIGRSADKVATAAEELGVKGITADVASVAAIDNAVAEVKEGLWFSRYLICKCGNFYTCTSWSAIRRNV